MNTSSALFDVFKITIESPNPTIAFLLFEDGNLIIAEKGSAKSLDENLEILKSLSPEEIFIITKAFTIFFYLSNISEQVFREHFLDDKNISIDKFSLNKVEKALIVKLLLSIKS